MKPDFRLARPQEAGQLPSIEQSAAQAFLGIKGLAWIAEHGVLSAADHLAFIAEGLDWLVVDEQDMPLGFLCACVQGDALHIEELAVDHAYQGQGLGRRLIAHVRDWAQGQGFTALTLTTFVEVPWNAPFYTRLGFVALDDGQMSDFLRRQLVYEHSRGLQGRCAMRQMLGEALFL
ncbi:GNAT family N-acetyltransferase [Pseudomonas fontis]|uniref:GNAT family N-acetyltransferase n=1 Tax=Pseudomonas fontis TaxID=2942633 RepID=A0ABT5NWE7_9PSED|nr:GNAT family N-acetyltransferase [Pseudomonas fontis]MDD0976228.1 GNAT family N-acetyltransferase [Pseudomonas fontis]MDD0992504.1 GNAT family N-acetyltransferase [Pseudomonas fontis]